MHRILFVCSGNICRSPTADGIARHWIGEYGLSGLIAVDSAGTGGYHVGEAPDPRAQKAALRRGYDLSKLRARKLVAQDYEKFDLLLAMDDGHLQFMRRQCPPEHAGKLKLLMDFALQAGSDEVPDPYYGGEAGFEVVLDLCEAGVQGVLSHFRARSGAA
ncbi:low molecular weight protein-tyrosine-phosphatase [Cognatazoarcus halotolerans]|uniref:low molecular weight protein-tyrosine-phosphatase n=1 Tax=Cognatazoarcus halotolerans TaxID=2686016 RepID=UPI00135B645F|nr:low molecular weight protein-tyrosine-phosphatase [Cognatazoarcus halotolerans]MBX3680939.1 low molecular weight phosphotyrosine protein phosphatase [Rhodocyclaceae bacterium]MCB1898043.1 low molecular weight phosphotyrosine protein phosphatase [Rhodocyclaceae bacterium]MCP5309265.1 low molecular weight phosphotyrosine protein phosphatase [Zoogloeaceae bacterium]